MFSIRKFFSSYVKPYLTRELGFAAVGALALFLYKYIVQNGVFLKWVERTFQGDPLTDMPYCDYIRLVTVNLGSFAVFFIVPFLFLLLFDGKKAFRLTGLGPGRVSVGLKLLIPLFAVLMPSVVVALFVYPEFGRYYPMAPFAASSLPLFLLYELSYILLFVGWEFLMHDFLLFPFEPRMGRAAILMSAMPFFVMHFGKPLPEAIGSFVACLVLGILALETRSFWYGALIHASIGVWMDTASIIVGKLRQ